MKFWGGTVDYLALVCVAAAMPVSSNTVKGQSVRVPATNH